ncbi:hypothetical protein ABB37_04682 [Leptomonas pyrrhocoris]|uniref:Cyclic nucleotide-binding domain-containing protein n=1 Tax=Leptomonas pyrrhocoris TaxID=157538 RepID=A0A0M9G1U8_LEPPY|nr:hypothetical protein ABB37_04682 [Leptomonas pyrrhocoris]KPA80456.1 hypothetical protein ABB37_04682 [Leptomonas pyrrhocoris]|eukprot:XP_015658895.1 hypothetical protein ABB37_04682 [Leptomonas pyrrhocoris]
MLTVSSGPGAPSVVESAAGYAVNAARRRRSSQRTSYQRRINPIGAGKHGSSISRDNTAEIHGISMDRLTYMNTALEALPGFALREYFVPIMRLKKQLLLRQRRSKERFPAMGTVAYTKMVTVAVASLAKSLSSAGGDLMLDGGTASFDVDAKGLGECLGSKLSPICMEAGSVLGYPREPPEASFVYIMLSGTVTVMHFQPPSLPTQQRRTGGGGSSRKERQTYFTSAKDVVRLCGGGAVQDAALLLDDYNGSESGAAVDAASTSNVTTAIQRSLRRASRTVGQPTLQYTRMEQLSGPVVLGASEAIGLAPCKYVSYIASAEPGRPVRQTSNLSSTINNSSSNKTDEVEVVQAFRVRTADVHAALIQLAAEQQAERQAKSPFRYVPWCTAAAGEAVAHGTVRTMADFVVAARRRTLYNDYAAVELMMRQSWLLQDAPSHTIRTLITHLEPHTYMPGEVIACPHTPGAERQLCFLRRGRLGVYTLPKVSAGAAAAAAGGGRRSPLNSAALQRGAASRAARDGCECWRTTDISAGAQPDEVVESGASFGELSVLFPEPRHCVLRAATICDAWCLPRRSFTRLMQRDTSVRDGLLQKAAVLRIEWMSEQRLTRALAQQLRASSELLRPLPDIALRLIQERLEPVVYAPGSLVVSTSTKCKEVIFIMHGSVSTICEGVATYGPGDVLGEGCLVPHRWPLGLAARTMVEGWRIKADQLRDAFRLVDKLHHYSGLVTSQTVLLMKRIFGEPQPPIEVDAVGRQRMPTVGAAPGGTTYLAFAHAVSEVQLRALCFLHRDYVRWEDIDYSCVDGGAAKLQGNPLNMLARELAIRHLNGSRTKSVASALTQQHQSPSASSQRRKTTAVPVTTENAAGKESGERIAGSAAAGTKTSAAGSGRNAVRASSSGRRSRDPTPHGDGPRGPRCRVASAGAFLVKNAFLPDEAKAPPFSASAPSATTGGGRPTSRRAFNRGAFAKHAITLPPRLQHMTRLLEERNRTWAAEQRHEATLAQQEASQREAAVRDQVALHASAAAPQRPSSPARGQTKAAVGGREGGALAPAPTTSHFSHADVSLAPVHIFLQAENPKYELDLREAVAIGYVMQLPDITHIQYSVSLVDPDVALGPPGQRARRHLMSITPNDRYNKHNFLFAASALEDGGSTESKKAAAEAAAAATLRSKARKLYTMMRTTVAARMDAAADQMNTTPLRQMSFEDSPGNESISPRPPDGLTLTDELQVRSPKGDAEGLVRSPSLSFPKTPLPQHTPQPPSPPVRRTSSVHTPSPFRSSAGKSRQRWSDEAFQRMLQREPVQAVDLLRKHYGVPWNAAAGSNGGGGTASGQSPTARHVTESRSGNASAFSSNFDVFGEPQRRLRRPSLLDRLEMAAAGGGPTTTPLSGLPSRDAVNTDAHGGELADAAELTSNEEVVLTNNTAPTYPPLTHATARDRWHCGNQLTLGSAQPASSAVNNAGADLPPAGQRRSQVNINAGANAGAPPFAVAPESGALNDYFYSNIRRRYPPTLFVEGYGPLELLSPEWVEYPPTIQIGADGGAAAGAGAGPDGSLEKVGGSGERSGAPVSASRVSRPITAIAVAAALRRSSSAFRFEESVSGHGYNNMSGVFGDHPNSAVAPRMEPFTMPTLEDTEVVIRRIQRDVNGLNAVAREQRRERDGARLRNGRIVKHRAAVAAALGTPDEQEQALLVVWRSQLARIGHDALRRASVPAALREEAGPDYMKRELRHLANAPVPTEDVLSRYTNDMELWQEQREQQRQLQLHGGRADVTPMHVVAASTPSGGGAGTRDGPRRVVATVGVGRLGIPPAPLQSPTAQMNNADRQTWLRQREDFFAAYKELLAHPGGRAGGGASTFALAAPSLRFAPAPPPPAKTPSQPVRHRISDGVVATSSTDTSYRAAFAHRTAGPTVDESQDDDVGSGRPSFDAPAAQPTSPPHPAMGDSADFHLRGPKPELPARYESPQNYSYSTEEQATPSAVDHRVAVTPPRELWNADDTQDYMDGSEGEYSSGESEEEEEEVENEHSAVLSAPDMVGNTSGNSSFAAAAATAAPAAASSAKAEEGEPGKWDRHDGLENAQEEQEEEVGYEEEFESESDQGEEGQAEKGFAAEVEEKDGQPAWLNI